MINAERIIGNDSVDATLLEHRVEVSDWPNWTESGLSTC